MQTAWTELVTKKESFIGGQIEMHQGLATHRGLIDDITLAGMYICFTLRWYAHLNGGTSNPCWIKLPSGKDFGRQVSLNVDCALRKINDHCVNFEIWDSDVHVGHPPGYGHIYSKDSPDGLIDPRTIRGLELDQHIA